MGRKVLVVDMNLCTGCRSCELRCAYKHHQECNPVKSRLNVVKFDRAGLSLPIFCLNCEEAFCQDICPTRAIQRNKETGALFIDEDRCIGCRACTMVCPFSGLHVLSNRRVVKCDLCRGDPYCVKYCETGALQYVAIEDVGVQKTYSLAERYISAHLRES